LVLYKNNKKRWEKIRKTNNTLREKKAEDKYNYNEKPGPARNMISQIKLKKKEMDDSSLKYK
jgi:hypothetical protein